MNLLDLLTSSILGALGCDMTTFIHYFPAADTMYTIFIGLGMGILLLNFVWQLFRNFGLGLGVDAEDPLKLTLRTLIFMLCVIYAAPIVNIALEIGGKPYDWILNSALPPLEFASFLSAITPIIGGLVSGSVVLIGLILLLVLAWNYLKLLLEAAERYILLGVIVYTAPIAFSLGGAQTTNSIFKNWCRMLGGQMFLLMMNAWCLKLFTTMVGTFLADPMGVGGNLFVWMLCAVGFLKVSQKIDSFMGSLGISVGRTGGSMVDDAIVAARGLSAAKKIGLAGGGGGGKLGGAGASGGSAGGTSSGAAPSTGFMQGGLVGAVGRKVSGAAASNLTSSPGGERGGVFSGIASQMYNNSIGKEGGFASKAIGSVATGSIGRNGMITGDKAGEALQAYMGAGIASSASQEDGMQPTVNAAPDGGDTAGMAPEAGMEQNIPMNPDEAGIVGAGAPGGPEGGAIEQGDNGESAIAAISGEATQDGHTPIPTGMDAQDAAGGMDGTAPEGMTGAAIPEGMDGAAVPSGADVSVSSGASSETTSDSGGTSAGAGGPASGGSVGTVSGGDGLAGSYMGGGGGTSYRDVTMGGGRITGTEVNGQHPNGIQFAMYNTDQYGKPEGAHSVVKSLDGAQWYKQYAQAAVERTPISEKDGKVEYNEKIVQKLPKAPQRLDRM